MIKSPPTVRQIHGETVLVAGGAGFIGSHLCISLVHDGARVICVDSLITGSRNNIASLLDNPRFTFIEHDIIQPLHGHSGPSVLSSGLKDLSGIGTKLLSDSGLAAVRQNDGLPQITAIYHLASPASPPQYQKYSIETLLVNSVGTYHLLELAKKHGARFLLASTSEVYGNPLRHPQDEGYFGNVNPNGVRACYDEGKRFAEAMTMEYVRKFSVDARLVRIFNTYGPRMQKTDGRVISNFVNQAITGKPLTIYGDGTQTRSFCYVSDMVAGLKNAVRTDGLKGEVINLGYPKEHTIMEIADIIVKHTGSVSPVNHLSEKPDDPVKRRPDISKAIRLLGWEPTTSLSVGLHETIEYYKHISSQ